MESAAATEVVAMQYSQRSQPLSVDEARTLYHAVAELSSVTRSLIGTIQELNATIREWTPMSHPPMRAQLPSVHDIAVEVADAVHRGIPSERVADMVRKVDNARLERTAAWVAITVAASLVSLLVAHFIHL